MRGTLSRDWQFGCASTLHKTRSHAWQPERNCTEDFIRDAASTYHHQTCTAKMGRDSMSVVDGQLKVYGIENLRIADGSIMPRVTTGNTMAPCIIIGERAAEALRTGHRLETSSVSRSAKVDQSMVRAAAE
jgi:choline dehydrogenase-like flavoprotein